MAVLRLVVISLSVVGAQDIFYGLVADAGSTGTRMYLFQIDGFQVDAQGPKLEIRDLGKGPALSSFQDHPGDAASTVRKQIEKAKTLIPVGIHHAVPVRIFATAGMRLVERAKADAIYAGLRDGLFKDFPFSKEAFQAKTISGREEGVYAFVAANYLSNRIGVDMKVKRSDLMGVLDLGGSSTQIAVPPYASIGRSIVPRLSDSIMYVKSFLSLGMERMRMLTFKSIVKDAHWTQRLSAKVLNPCAFADYSDDGEPWRGTGDAVQCQRVISAVLRSETDSCQRSAQASQSCLPLQLIESARAAVSEGGQRFFLISGYEFVADFARWWLEHPGVVPKASKDTLDSERKVLAALAQKATFTTPTITELRAAAAVMCATPWSFIREAVWSNEHAIDHLSSKTPRHKFTNEHKAPHRCFELNYITTLLSVGYGFPEEARAFHYIDAIDGRDVEWSLGAFLLSRATDVDIMEHADRQTDLELRTASSVGLRALYEDHGSLAFMGPLLLVALIGLFAWRRFSKNQDDNSGCFPSSDAEKCA